MTEEQSSSVTSWIQQLTEEDMPVFACTVSDVTNAVNNDNTSAADVAHTILRDASLTGRLLKMANSFYYNPGRYQINTVTRAVMVLGFDQVRALALSLILIDSLSEAGHREKIVEEMAQSFHAAVQAEELAKLSGNKEPENIFVATLLSRLGQMAFWAFSGDKGSELQALLDSSDMTEQEAEHKVLGFHLNHLTKDLSKSWSLGDLLDKSLNDNYANDPLVELIHMGQYLASEAKNGWDEEGALNAIAKVAKKLKIPVKKLEELAHRNAKKAKEITRDYGISAASNIIPVATLDLVDVVVTKVEKAIEEDNVSVKKRDEVDKPSPEFHQPNVDIQLSILQEITEAIEDKPSINTIIEMVLEGVYRGVGMDRAMFAIISPDGKNLNCKYALGEGSDALTQHFKIDISHKSNIFHKVIISKKGSHIPSDPKLISGTVCKETFELLGFPPYIIMPTIIKNKVVGIFLADRNASGRDIEKKDFLSFQQFCQQANMGLTFLTMQD